MLHEWLRILFGDKKMKNNEKRVDYICPYSLKCKLKKKCHVLTTVNKLKEPIKVKQICPAQGRDADGKKIEIEIEIG